ncbi:OmpA/MotB family protein [Arthrobacter roseus]|uniref:OmpA/MotB family protein n=1 Tax=Arthrobacter roseus TaxID=136274 RepID=UPI001965C5CC|nr:flagellar motor protein MotB [Arthrobacter roseus]MBM7847670.1 chemotaxis protein MotB [Arthrobacter roseus]
MSPRRKSGLPQEEHEEHVDERWMASYMDMVTVLMCMFIVLFAMSTVDANKFEQLRNSLATGFGSVEMAAVDTAEGTVVPAEHVNDEGEGFANAAAAPAVPVSAPEPTTEPAGNTDMDRAVAEVEDLRKLQARIDANLQKDHLAKSVRYTIDERGLTIRLISSEAYFLPDRAQLSEKTGQILDAIGPVLATTKHQISVEGHTAKLPETYRYPLDWELSTERSVNVVRHVVEKGRVPANRVAAVGFGQSRPLANGDSEAELKLNRRVDIVALSDQPENVRKLIPEVTKNP